MKALNFEQRKMDERAPLSTRISQNEANLKLRSKLTPLDIQLLRKEADELIRRQRISLIHRTLKERSK